MNHSYEELINDLDPKLTPIEVTEWKLEEFNDKVFPGDHCVFWTIPSQQHYSDYEHTIYLGNFEFLSLVHGMKIGSYLRITAMKKLIMRNNTRLVVRYKNDSIESRNKTLKIGKMIQSEIATESVTKGDKKSGRPKTKEFRDFYNKKFKALWDLDPSLEDNDKHYYCINDVNVCSLLRCGRPIRDSYTENETCELDEMLIVEFNKEMKSR